MEDFKELDDFIDLLKDFNDLSKTSMTHQELERLIDEYADLSRTSMTYRGL